MVRIKIKEANKSNACIYNASVMIVGGILLAYIITKQESVRTYTSNSILHSLTSKAYNI
jgi:hypothetical protein